MSTTRAQDVVAEAICSAFYNMDFCEFMGERDDPGGSGNLVTWFMLGKKPRQVRVAIYREKDGMVEVVAEWLNFSADPTTPMKGQLKIAIATHVGSDADLRMPTQNAVVRVLEIYKDVLEEVGVAGPLEPAAPEPAHDNDDEELEVE